MTHQLGVLTAEEIAENKALNAAAQRVRAENIRRVALANRNRGAS